MRVAARALRRVRRGHRHAGHALGAEGVDRDEGDQRRVDPAREPDDHVLEAALGHVVARAEDERRVDLGVGVEQLRQIPARRRRVGAALGREGSEVGHHRRHLARRRPRAGVAQARGPRGLDVDVAHQELLGELRRAGDHVAVVVDHERVTVEDQLVLAADERAEGHRGEAVARALGDHLLALAALAGLVGRGGDVEHQPRAGQRLVGHRRTGDPDVLADGEADLDPVDLDDRPAGAALEVAQLVEDPVVGQVDLAVDGLQAAVCQHRRGVVDVVGALGEADERHDALRVGRDPLDRRPRVGQEVLLEQQVLGRVAGDRQLGEERELRAGLARARELLANLGLVAGDVADGGVDLGEGDAHPSPNDDGYTLVFSGARLRDAPACGPTPAARLRSSIAARRSSASASRSLMAS